jgi:hypothetical protein
MKPDVKKDISAIVAMIGMSICMVALTFKGGNVTEDISKCTHLVMQDLRVTTSNDSLTRALGNFKSRYGTS